MIRKKNTLDVAIQHVNPFVYNHQEYFDVPILFVEDKVTVTKTMSLSDGHLV